MNTYLSQSHINQIAYICNQTFSKANKAKLLELGRKYDLTFCHDRQTNMNLLWFKVVEILKQDPKAIDTISRNHFSKQIKEAGTLGVQEMMLTYFHEHHMSEDYQFLCNFKPEKVLYEINEITRFSGLHYHYEIDELYKVDNYEKYFSKMFGIESIDPKAVKNTQRVADFFNTLFNGIPNKNLNAVIEYLQHNDITTLHNTLHYHE